MMRLRALVAAVVLALVPSCSLLLVRPVLMERQPDGLVRPTCVTNSYVWPALDAAAALFFLVWPILAFRENEKVRPGAMTRTAPRPPA